MQLKENICNIEDKLLNSYEVTSRNIGKKMIPNLMDDLGAFYKYANNFSDMKSDIGLLINQDGDITADP